MIRANSFLGGKVYFRVNGELNPVSAKEPLDDETVKKESDEVGEELTLQSSQEWLREWRTLTPGMK